ncbi:hypothetical protein G6F65_020012 [Rhizopus arrhizus]|nr:hypothetical protein G6F65_020012 [Rhizopus arrhizus]
MMLPGRFEAAALCPTAGTGAALDCFRPVLRGSGLPVSPAPIPSLAEPHLVAGIDGGLWAAGRLQRRTAHDGARAAGGEPCFLDRHLRPEFRARDVFRGQERNPQLAGDRLAGGGRRHAVHRTRPTPRSACHGGVDAGPLQAGRCGGTVPGRHDDRRLRPASFPRQPVRTGAFGSGGNPTRRVTVFA